MNHTIFLGLLCIALNGCSLDSEPQHLSNETVATKTVSNNGLSVSLHFKGKVNTDNEQLEWNETSQEPYIAAANKWLSVLKGIEGKEHHHVDINVYVEPLDNANGMAGPDEDEKVGPYYFPLSGEIIIGSHTYQIGFDQKEFNANIVHEMGHVFGVGSYSYDYTHYDENQKGNVFSVYNSESLKRYNELYNMALTALPISDDGGHLYDYVWQGDKKRVLDDSKNSDAKTIAPMTQEVMSNGFTLGVISVALLDDIGYIVDYSQVTSYAP